MIKEYELCIEKINDSIQKFIPMKVPLDSSILDVKCALDSIFGLRLDYQILYFKDKLLHDSDKLASIYEEQYKNRSKMHKLDIKLLYNYDSEDELFQKANTDFRQNSNNNKEFNIKTHVTNQEKLVENREGKNSYWNSTGNTHVISNQHNSHDQNNLIKKKRPREEDSYRDYNHYTKKQKKEDFNPWNTKKRSNKGIFSSNYKTYNEDLTQVENDTEPNDFDKLKNLLDFDKEFFKMPKMTFDESKLNVSMKARIPAFNRVHEDITTKNVYELCEKFLFGSIDYNKVPTVIVELPTTQRKPNIFEKEELLDFQYIIEENDAHISNIEDLISKLSESQIQSDIKIGSGKEFLNDKEDRYEDNEVYDAGIIEDYEAEKIEECQAENIDDEEMGLFPNINQLYNDNVTIQNNLDFEYIIEEVIEKETEELAAEDNTIIIDPKNLPSIKPSSDSSNNDQLSENKFAEVIPLEESIIIEEEKIPRYNPIGGNEMIREEKIDMADQSKSAIVPEKEFYHHNIQVSEAKLNSRSHTREEIKKQFECLYQSRRQTKDITNYIENLKHFNNILDDVNIDSSFIMMNPKLNIVLDLDSTLIYAKVSHFKYHEVKDEIDVFQEEMTIESKIHFVTIKIRPYVKEFLTKIKNYSTFYINTHGLFIYGKTIAEKLEAFCNIKIPVENIRGRTHTFKSLGQFNERNKFLEKSIIIDDTTRVWDTDKKSIHVLINSMRYVSFYDNKKLKTPEFRELEQLVSNYELNLTDIKNETSCREPIAIDYMLNDDNFLPLCSEYNHSNKYQMKYLAEFIEKVYKITTITDCI